MIRHLRKDASGSAAVEMALVTPMLLILMMGAFELGNYFVSEHILIKGLRDGAVYAARQNIVTNYDCSAGTPTVPSGVVTNTENIVRSGELSGGTDRLPNWSSATFSVTVNCATTAGSSTMSGMYALNGGKAPVLTVSAQVPYRTVLGSIGVDVGNFTLGGSEQAAAIGI